jgi:hypothetical protein
MQWLYLPVALLGLGGLVLIFLRDWVWSIDSRSKAFERDEDGEAIRTPAWDRAHLIQGIVMLVTAGALACVVYFVF